MVENTKIEWAKHTFNPWIGCQKVGPGCDNCYAEIANGGAHTAKWGPKAERVRTKDGNWMKPITWNNKAAAAGERHTVFCSSLADVFDNHTSVDPAWRMDLAALILKTPHLDWLLLTKRVGLAERMLTEMFPGGVPSNIWLGATIVNQEEADRDIPKLMAAKKALGLPVAYLSMEPLLGPVTLPDAPDWVIVGGETGALARPMHIEWVRGLRDQCAALDVPFLFKQWGNWFPYGEIDGNGLINSRTRGEKHGLWHEWAIAEMGFSVFIDKTEAGRFLDGNTHDGLPVKGAA
jgi:protein gp37